jgi:hypothetical protein
MHFTSIEALTVMQAATALADGPLFPNLRQLRLDISVGYPMEDMTQFNIFLSPSTIIFHFIGFVAKNSTNLSFLASLAHRCPKLEDVGISSNIKLSSRSLEESLSGMVHLRNLELGVNSGEAMAALSSLSNLQTLVAFMVGLNDSSSSATTGGFPCLTKLDCFVTGNLSPALWAIRFLTKATPLACLTLSSTIPSPVQTITSIIELLPTYVNNHTLVNFSIRELVVDADAMAVVPVANELLEDPFHLSLLGSFHALKILRIEVTPAVFIGFQAIQPLEHLDLETLVVGYFENGVYAQYTPKIRLQDLVQVLGMFPSLRTLGLPIDATAVSPSLRRPGRGFVHNLCLWLMVGASPVDRVQDVAAFLSDILPRLGSIQASRSIAGGDGIPPIENPYHQTWEKVDELVSFFSVIREQERKTALLGFSETDEE